MSYELGDTLSIADRFLIFSLARTGSTALMDALNSHPSIRCIHEPFNPANEASVFANRVTNSRELTDSITQIYREYTGIKHVWDPTGWPFANDPQLNFDLLTCGARVLLLRRINVLRRIVSLQICQQTGCYKFDLWEKTRVRRFPFAPLDRSQVKTALDQDRHWLDDVCNALTAARVEYREVVYERLFDAAITADSRIDQINEILRFIGKPELAGQRTVISGIKQVLNPAHKVLIPEVYATVPGIQDIEDEFGCDETGWLFKD